MNGPGMFAILALSAALAACADHAVKNAQTAQGAPRELTVDQGSPQGLEVQVPLRPAPVPSRTHCQSADFGGINCQTE